MDKVAIKNYAVWARVQLIESCKQRAFEYGITEDGENRINVDSINGRILTAEEKEQRRKLIEQINQNGFSQVMEEAAYTWFNRFIALRFMEVNGYLPSKVRVFTDEDNSFKPEILKEAMTVDLDGIDRAVVADLLEKQDNEELYKYLLITQCNALNGGLPYMFETISNWTELLFPDNLLRNDSVVGRLISDICADDWTDEVEIIGWLYQYYISERHDEVIDPLHGKVIKKEDIPAATQLFTTDWVVRYIVDNSLGRYWIERHHDSKLADSLEYFVMPKDGKLPLVNESITPEEIKVLDPCVGSGHFLSYAFDVLLNIYRECGWSDRDAAKSIIEHNLYGLDIDDRAVQLACFAVTMKARKYNRRIIDQGILPNIYAIQESSFMSEEFIDYVYDGDNSVRNDLNELQIAFQDGKELGSIIKAPKIDIKKLTNRIDSILSSPINDLKEIEYKKRISEKLMPLIRQVTVMVNQYEAVVTNPPYLNRYSPKLKEYIKNNYAEYKGDLFSVFMIRDFDLCRNNGYSGFMTPFVWMFINTYEQLRRFVISSKCISSFIQMEYSAYKEATVPICAFVLQNTNNTTKGAYFKLSDFKGDMEVQRQKVLEAINNSTCNYLYYCNQQYFLKIPGSPIAYWVSKKAIDLFGKESISQFYDLRVGLMTTDNKTFLRLFWEVDNHKICFNANSSEDAKTSKLKWFPHNKGGSYRKWAGNRSFIVDWENDGEHIKQSAILKYPYLNGNPNFVVHDDGYYFKENVSWSEIAMNGLAFRYYPKGFTFNIKGMSAFPLKDSSLFELLAFCNSCVCHYYSRMMNSSISFGVNSLGSIPFIKPYKSVNEIVKDNISLSTTDWDSFETSWDFKKHPLI